ncbi:MAG: DNA-directed RNA polymerase subunit G [Candidatus Methanomethylicia archaeon]
MSQINTQKVFKVMVQLIDSISKIPGLFHVVMSSHDVKISMQIPKKVFTIKKNKEYLVYLDSKPISNEEKFDFYMQGKVISLYKNDKFTINISVGGLIVSIEMFEHDFNFKIGDNVYLAIALIS